MVTRWAQDEHRLGLLPVLRRVWALRGRRPTATRRRSAAATHDYPPWQTVSDSFRRWRRDGSWERIAAALRARARIGAGRDPQPSAAILDSQSVKTTEKGGRAATTRASRPTGASATCSSTPGGWSSPATSTRPT